MSTLIDRIGDLPAEKRDLILKKLREKERDRLPFYDIIILGGGLAGLTLALQLRQQLPQSAMLVIEREQYPVPEAAHKVGESTSEIAAHYFHDIIGAASHLRERQLRKLGLRMFFPADGNRTIETRPELGLGKFLPFPTYQLDRGRLENYLAQSVQEQGISLWDGSKVTDLTLNPDQKHQVELTRKGERLQVTARWLVDASGRNTLIQRRLELKRKVGHQANAVWFRINQEIDIDCWSEDPEWRMRINNGDLGGRWLSTNHLMDYGYWVWVIPLASHSTSVGIVVDDTIHPFDTMNRLDRALEWLRKHEPQCAAEVESRLDDLMDFRVLRHFAYSCKQVYSSDRWCLTGEAGVFTDPFYSPGSDHIAISNTFITDLIVRDLNGEDISDRAYYYNTFFLQLTDLWFTLYEQQYTLMGNAQVMRCKIMWDVSVYWGIFALIFFQKKYPSQAMNHEGNKALKRIGAVIRRMQAFFREWNGLSHGLPSHPHWIDYGTLEHMYTFHQGLGAELDDEAFQRQLEQNLSFFERLAGEIAAQVFDWHSANDTRPAWHAQREHWSGDQLLTSLMAAYRATNQPRTGINWAEFTRPDYALSNVEIS